MSRKGNIVVFSAPSGAGKSTILTEITKRVPDLFFSISATTRAPRGSEKDGEDYYFYSREEFEKMIASGGFIEWAEVHGNLYGTPRAPIDIAVGEGKTAILDIDVQGKSQLDRVYPEAIGIFIEVPSFVELERRLRNRGTDSEDAISLRLKNARFEQDYAHNNGKYEYYVVNDDLQETVDKIHRIFKLKGIVNV